MIRSHPQTEKEKTPLAPWQQASLDLPALPYLESVLYLKNCFVPATFPLAVFIQARILR